MIKNNGSSNYVVVARTSAAQTARARSSERKTAKCEPRSVITTFTIHYYRQVMIYIHIRKKIQRTYPSAYATVCKEMQQLAAGESL